MLTKSVLVVDLGAGSIKLLYGSRSKIKKCGYIETPENSMEDNNILDVEKIHNIIKEFIIDNKIKPSDISFSIYGQDIVTRHIEVPNMNRNSIKQAVDWEIGQNLPEAGKNYYIDYEIISDKKERKGKTLQVIAVAVPREKIERYMDLAEKLNLKVQAIDISANCVSRVFNGLSKGKGKSSSIGIIDIGRKSTSITILDGGKSTIVREVPFGIDKLLKEIEKVHPMESINPYDYLVNKFSFDDIENELDNRLKKQFENVFSTFQKVIQFYSTGRIEKNISKLYIIGGGGSVKGLKNYIESYLTTPTTIMNSPADIGCNIKLPINCDLKYYVNVLGLLLREA